MMTDEVRGAPSQTVLIVEDEPSIARLAKMFLERDGFRVVIATDGAQALEMHAREHPDLVILDIMLPRVDGREVLKQIRQWADTPVIMVTALRETEDRIGGLDLGADDYIAKPFSPRELVSRVHAVLRRSARSHAPADDVLRFPGLEIFPQSHRVEVNGKPVELTAKEFLLLLTLAGSPRQLFTREALLSRVWGFDFLGDSRTVDVHIGTLRRKIEPDPSHPRYIKTIWRAGYLFEPPAESESEPAS
jgi:two-component system response regulator ResD